MAQPTSTDSYISESGITVTLTAHPRALHGPRGKHLGYDMNTVFISVDIGREKVEYGHQALHIGTIEVHNAGKTYKLEEVEQKLSFIGIGKGQDHKNLIDTCRIVIWGVNPQFICTKGGKKP